ncbi:hypothetical protein HWV62_6219 [Athelia sp. TMB]|nr:hypothetical protein HWV62_6219 [Athelia sp. TMB]
MVFVAPLTPSNIGDISRLKCVQDADEPLMTRIPRTVFELLYAIALVDMDDDQYSENSLSLYSSAWPTLWIWVQYIYPIHHSLLQQKNATMNFIHHATFGVRYNLFLGTLMKFVHNSTLPTFADIMDADPKISSMMADMWMREGLDKYKVHGFQSAGFTDKFGARPIFLEHVVSACGSAEGIINIICQRLRRNLGHSSRSYREIQCELRFLYSHISQDEPSPLVSPMCGSSRLAITLMQVLSHVVSKAYKSETSIRDWLMCSCVAFVPRITERSPVIYQIIVDIINHDFIPLMLRSIALVQSTSKMHEAFVQCVISTIKGVFCPAIVHREIAFLMERSFSIVAKASSKVQPPARSHAQIKSSFEELRDLIARGGEYKEYRKGNNRSILYCGNGMVNNLRLCSCNFRIPNSSNSVTNPPRSIDVLGVRFYSTAVESAKKSTGLATRFSALT